MNDNETLRAIRDQFKCTSYAPRELLGRGGGGLVVGARHRALGKDVAIKIVASNDARDVERFRVEAQALARLSHKNLVDVTDFGVLPDGRTFFVMERLVGRSLRAFVDEHGQLEWSMAVRFARHILAAVGAAHRIGVIHRDLKPENVFVCDPSIEETNARPSIKVLDFGLAKVVAPSIEGPEPSLYSTDDGEIVGTARFASPEQASGGVVDHRTDLYGVGALLFFMLTGAAPFEHRRDLASVARAIREEVPAPPSRFAPVPASIDAAVRRSLAKDPNERFQSAVELASALLAPRPTIRKVPRTAPLALDDLPPSPIAPEFLRAPGRRR